MIGIGRSEIFLKSLRHLSSKGYSIQLIITDEPYNEYNCGIDKFREFADEVGSEIVVTKKIDVKLFDKILNKRQEIVISVNWKYMLTKEIISLFNGNVLNFHLGNLPDYKGNATINWSILNGETYIYANVHKMVSKVDSGDIIARRKIRISEETYVAFILKEAEDLAPILFESAIRKITRDGKYFLIKGTEKGIRCYPRLPEDANIYWNEKAEQICRLIRASSKPFEGAYTFFHGRKIIIWKAQYLKNHPKVYAVPGSIVKINKNENYIDVATGDGLIRIGEIFYYNEKDEIISDPSLLTNSIRSRLTSIISI